MAFQNRNTSDIPGHMPRVHFWRFWLNYMSRSTHDFPKFEKLVHVRFALIQEMARINFRDTARRQTDFYTGTLQNNTLFGPMGQGGRSDNCRPMETVGRHGRMFVILASRHQKSHPGVKTPPRCGLRDVLRPQFPHVQTTYPNLNLAHQKQTSDNNTIKKMIDWGALLFLEEGNKRNQRNTYGKVNIKVVS